jgi:hypothetical protein
MSEALPHVANEEERGDKQRDKKEYGGQGSLAQTQLMAALSGRAAAKQLGQFLERCPRLHFGLTGVSNNAFAEGCGRWPDRV